jgi:carboxyl-terminal processing protease
MIRTLPVRTALLGVLGVGLLTGYTGRASSFAATPAAVTPAAAAATCSAGPPPSSSTLQPTTVDTLEQAYRCIFAHYYGGAKLNDQLLLGSAFAALIRELQWRGIDQPGATMPAMTGDRDHDWTAFSAVYQTIVQRVKDADVRQALAEAALNGLVAALHDNHAHWVRSAAPPQSGPQSSGLGIVARQGTAGAAGTPALIVTSVAAGSPAARKGVRPGDVIVSVNGVPTFMNHTFSREVLPWMNATDGPAVRLTLSGPYGERTRTMSIKPGTFPAPTGSAVSAKLLRGDIAYVAFSGFTPDVADQVLQAINRLRAGRTLHGVIIDVRGNHGGLASEVTKLLGAFAHGKVTSYQCDGDGNCTASRTDDSVPLLNLKLVELTDHDCGSACDDFSAAVKDLGLGALVGTRTAGVVAGPFTTYLLNDGSQLQLPSTHHLGATKELIDTIGVAADYQEPLTAQDAATGRDRALTKALSLLP